MGRNPSRSSDKLRLQKGSWTAAEDKILIDFIKAHGEGKWNRIMKQTGLRRCGKSCRLRWLNYLRPDIKRGNISSDEEQLIIRLHKLLGNRWSLIAGRLPGRTDNEIKNYWNTNLGKKAPDVQLSHFRGFSHDREPPSQSQDHPVPSHESQEPVTVPVPPASNYSSYGSPSLSLNSTENHLMDFNLDGEDIRQILESADFSGINQAYIDGLLSPEPELEVDNYLSMFEEHDFQSRRVPSPDKTSTNVCLMNGDAGMIGSSDFVPLFEDHGKWLELDD